MRYLGRSVAPSGRNFAGLLLALVAVFGLAPSVSAQSSGVYAVLCGPGAELSISQPVSDSVTDQPTIPLVGTISQANQVEVYVDDIFDHVIPIAAGQVTFNDEIALSPGTHTIKLVAIDVCPSASNGEMTSVVTYTPPPAPTPSVGGEVPTQVDEQKPGTTTVNPADDDRPRGFLEGLVPATYLKPFQDIGAWLNMAPAYDSTEALRLTPIRAVVITFGGWLMAFGLTQVLTQRLAVAMTRFASLPVARRQRIASIVARLIGLLIVLAALFL